VSTGKIIGIVVLVAVIVGAIVYTVRRGGAAKPPERVLKAEVKLIGVKEPFEIKTITVEQKQNLARDEATGYYKIDGALWADPHTCVSCGAQIPAVAIKPGTEKPGQLMTAYVCPKCGKAAYEPQ